MTILSFEELDNALGNPIAEPSYTEGTLDSYEQLVELGKLEHCQLDHIGDNFNDDPLLNLIAKEEEQGGPIALCRDSTACKNSTR